MDKKKFIKILLPLIVFNIALAFNIFFSNEGQTESGDCLNYNKIYLLEDTYKISEEVRCENCDSVGVGDTLFEYYGDDAKCLGLRDKLSSETCRMNHPFGNLGTFIAGGNLAIMEADGLYFNGYDVDGYHWLMSTTSEPLGNVIGFNRSSQDVYFGNNVIINDIIDLVNPNQNNKVFYQSGHEIFHTTESVLVPAEDDGRGYDTQQSVQAGVVVVGDDRLMVVEENKEMCGACSMRKENSLTGQLEMNAQVCSGENDIDDGNTGRDYSYLLSSGLDVEGSLRVDDKIRLSKNLMQCENNCSHETWYGFFGSDPNYSNPYAFKFNNFYNNYEIIDDEAIYFECRECDKNPKVSWYSGDIGSGGSYVDPDGNTITNGPFDMSGEGHNQCFPQPYPRFRLYEYDVVSDGNGGNKVDGHIERCTDSWNKCWCDPNIQIFVGFDNYGNPKYATYKPPPLDKRRLTTLKPNPKLYLDFVSDCEGGGGTIPPTPADIDSDGDGIANIDDNCDYDKNYNQADNDGDGIGNVCDTTPG